jgi:hypothetical protein
MSIFAMRQCLALEFLLTFSEFTVSLYSKTAAAS